MEEDNNFSMGELTSAIDKVLARQEYLKKIIKATASTEDNETLGKIVRNIVNTMADEFKGDKE